MRRHASLKGEMKPLTCSSAVVASAGMMESQELDSTSRAEPVLTASPACFTVASTKCEMASLTCNLQNWLSQLQLCVRTSCITLIGLFTAQRSNVNTPKTVYQAANKSVSILSPRCCLSSCAYAGWMSTGLAVISASQMFSCLQLRRPCRAPVAPLSEGALVDLLINIIRH